MSRSVNMSGWAGFTDEDLKRVRKLKVDKSSENTNKSESRNSPPKEANFNKTKPGNRHHHPSLQQHHVTSPRQATPSSTVTSSQQGTVSSTRPGTGNKIPKVQTETADTTREDLLDIKKEMDEIDTKEALRREMGNLEKFREQQKMIEEANKQRKALLSKTLSERQKAAQQEARKLAHIQREVMILDNLLTADVNVIRSRIEVASREFLDAQKRYERAEKEFIDAKMDLQKKSEHKEQLTEHLYTIIHQNELRKANKLSELMKELEMEQNAESQILPTLPPLSAFNSVSTLHSPKSPPHTTETIQRNPETVNQASPTKSSSDQDKIVKHNENTKSVICLGSDDSVDNSGDHVNSKQSNSNVQDSISDSSRNVKNVNLKDGTAKDQCLETDEIVIEGLSTNSNSSVNNESRTENIEGGGVVDLTSDSGSGTCENEPKSVTSEKGDNHGKHKPEVALPSAWTLDVVKNEHIS